MEWGRIGQIILGDGNGLVDLAEVQPPLDVARGRIYAMSFFLIIQLPLYSHRCPESQISEGDFLRFGFFHLAMSAGRNSHPAVAAPALGPVLVHEGPRKTRKARNGDESEGSNGSDE